MLSIGEFSKICKVSTKTLRYYAEMGLLLPEVINPENSYRYYAIDQLEKMLFINRLKSYGFSLEEIKTVLDSEDVQEEVLYQYLATKETALKTQIVNSERTLEQLQSDLSALQQGNTIMDYLDHIAIQLVEAQEMKLLSIRQHVPQHALPDAYRTNFQKLFHRIHAEDLTLVAEPMVLFHNDEFCPLGIDIEFALSIKEAVHDVRIFQPGLCLKTVLHGAYTNLPSVYARQCAWAEKEGYVSSDALYEVYVNDPSVVIKESELVTEVYYPVKRGKVNA